MCSYFPKVITDWYNLLTFYEAGLASAGASTRPPARLWNMIFPMCDSYTSSQVVNKLLVWMPAHKSASAIGQFFKSDGRSMTAIDWRANRLVDSLARLAACRHAVPNLAVELFKGAQQAAEYCAALLGTVTFASNNCKVQIVKPNGDLSIAIRRDSAPGKRPSNFSKPEARQTPFIENIADPFDGAKGVKRAIQLGSNPNQPPVFVASHGRATCH